MPTRWWDDEDFIGQWYRRSSKSSRAKLARKKSTNRRDDPDPRTRGSGSTKRGSTRSPRRLSKKKSRATYKTKDRDALIRGAILAGIPLVGTQLYILENKNHPLIELIAQGQKGNVKAILAGTIAIFGWSFVYNMAFRAGGAKETVAVDKRTKFQRLMGHESQGYDYRTRPRRPIPGLAQMEANYFLTEGSRIFRMLNRTFWGMAIIELLNEIHISQTDRSLYSDAYRTTATGELPESGREWYGPFSTPF